MSQEGQIELIVRGVCVRNGKLLLCHTKGARNTYLPGGHIECSESARDSLCREIKEEMGKKARAGRFVGVVEHTFKRRGQRYCEINLLFDLKVMDIDSSKNPSSCEEYIDFRWVPLKKLADSKLEPAVLRRVLALWLRNKGMGSWASTWEE
jgi:8-oxo-dGTP diphosphatase